MDRYEVIKRAREMRRQIERTAEKFTDTEALKNMESFPRWSGNGATYPQGYRVRFGDGLWRCIVSHISCEEVCPSEEGAPWKELIDMDYNSVPEWELLPLGYSRGEQVTYRNRIWTSLVDRNICTPTDDPDSWEMIAEI